ncbi:MAG: transglutaminase-like domain-containing protein [Muribaculaceae bacterium]|nr:transglutaminase-like domain-containing protein [Muribaculaceae bacterium]
MIRLSISFITIFMLAVNVHAETIKIQRPEWFDHGIYDGKQVFPDSLFFDSDAEEITFPDLGVFVRLGGYNFPNLRKVTLGNVDYMPALSFGNMPMLEEVIVNGMVGHFDCTFVQNCPKLKKIVFNGPVSSTGGMGFTYNCPNLEEVVFEGVVGDFDLGLSPGNLSPKLKRYTINGAVIDAGNDTIATAATIEQFRINPRLRAELDSLAQWQMRVLTATTDNDWLRSCCYSDAKIIYPILSELGSPEAEPLKAAMEYAWNHYDDVKTKIEILKGSPAYALDSLRKGQFVYVQPNDSLLTATRNKFNLDSIAGNGDDISRIKNLLYWVHNSIKHDGGNGLPDGARTLTNIYESSRRDSCGYNCRALAIGLCEALLAEGIPARYITCQSKQWDTDQDCHVICVAWSESLNKWIWVDPTFAAYVTDENGLLLHPGEVRYRLQNDLPLVLNADANWNNISAESKESYLDDYMAKNLYIIEANILNQAEPEGKSDHIQGYFAALVPMGSNYDNANIITTDDDWFWQAPTAFYERSKPKSDIKIR